MKKNLLILFLLIASPIIVTACEICGCGVGNNYIGILPDFRKHIFGLRYRYNSMLTHLGAGGDNTYLTTKETFNSIDAWGGWNIGKKFRVMASIPFNFNERNNLGISQYKNGLGDISISSYFQLINSKHTMKANKLLVQSLWIGGGIKLPTGKYNPDDKNSTTENANLFQLGTGSYDFNIGIMYDIRLQDLGINITSNYKITTKNKDQYKYGNKINLNAQAYYKFRIKNAFSLAPNTGIQYENARTDTDNGFTVFVSGGDLLLGTAGIESAIGKMAIGANFQIPLNQNLASGIIRANNRIMFHVAVAL